MKKIFLYISALLAGAACSAQETLLSPDGRLRLEFSLADGGRPTYTLDYKERPADPAQRPWGSNCAAKPRSWNRS